MLLVLLAGCVLGSVADVPPPRERLSIDSGWRFHQGDPADLQTVLDYDVRPAVSGSTDGQAADTRPEQGAQVASDRAVLQPWILPTANSLIADRAARHRRPAGDPGSNVSFVQADFNDTTWQAVDLPHAPS